MRKLTLVIAGIIVTSLGFAASVDSSGANNWGVSLLPSNGLHFTSSVYGSELVGMNAGPVSALTGQIGTSYGFGNGIVMYGNVVGTRSWDALKDTEYPGVNSSRYGEMINVFQPVLGAQYTLQNGVNVGIETSYTNGGVAPGIGNADAKSVGYGIAPYVQYSFGKNSVFGQYNYQNLWNAEMQNFAQYSGNGIQNKFTGAYTYSITEDLTVGVTGTYQIVNYPYALASAILYQNSNNYTAATASTDYIELKPGVSYNVPQIPGLTIGISTGLDWFGFRNCNQLPASNGNWVNYYTTAIVVIPAANYSLSLGEGLVWNINAQYNGVKTIYNPANFYSEGNGGTINSSFQMGTGLSYSF